MIFTAVFAFVVVTRRPGETWLTMICAAITIWTGIRVAGAVTHLF